MVLDILAVDNFDFTRKIVKKKLDEKLVKMLGFCQNWIFGQKFDFSNSVAPEHIFAKNWSWGTWADMPYLGLKKEKKIICDISSFDFRLFGSVLFFVICYYSGKLKENRIKNDKMTFKQINCE